MASESVNTCKWGVACMLVNPWEKDMASSPVDPSEVGVSPTEGGMASVPVSPSEGGIVYESFAFFTQTSRIIAVKKISRYSSVGCLY